MANESSILVIEDDQDISRLVAFRLKKEGYAVIVAHDGTEGLDLVFKKHPQLIILDLMLPGLPGEELCKKVREHDDAAINKIPIIMLTAKNTEVDGIVGRVIGANFYMTKPFSMEELLQRIRKIISEQTV